MAVATMLTYLLFYANYLSILIHNTQDSMVPHFIEGEPRLTDLKEPVP